ncbi:hypothetical protein BLGI_3858 [Brevibacillus laterosporus GI-9]|nr:hypothetical protein BLGI_3858 [Brevibacillus laterosporus GI-9]
MFDFFRCSVAWKLGVVYPYFTGCRDKQSVSGNGKEVGGRVRPSELKIRCRYGARASYLFRCRFILNAGARVRLLHEETTIAARRPTSTLE